LSGRALPGQVISDQLRSLRLKRNSAALRENLFRIQKAPAVFGRGFGSGVIRELAGWIRFDRYGVKEIIPQPSGHLFRFGAAYFPFKIAVASSSLAL
jgi:hypothetical protein